MLSNKVIDYLNKQGVYSEKEDKAYKKALIDLGIDLNHYCPVKAGKSVFEIVET